MDSNTRMDRLCNWIGQSISCNNLTDKMYTKCCHMMIDTFPWSRVQAKSIPPSNDIQAYKMCMPQQLSQNKEYLKNILQQNRKNMENVSVCS